jgi:hypothetical protein
VEHPKPETSLEKQDHKFQFVKMENHTKDGNEHGVDRIFSSGPVAKSNKKKECSVPVFVSPMIF